MSEIMYKKPLGIEMINKSKITVWCKFIELVLILGIILIPIFGQLLAWLPAGQDIAVASGILHVSEQIVPVIQPNPLIVAISIFLGDFMICMILWQFYKAFKDIRHGFIFHHSQIQRVSKSGYLIIMFGFYSMCSDMLLTLLQSPEGSSQYYIQMNNLIYIPVGVGLIILSHVLQLAITMKEEQDLVI